MKNNIEQLLNIDVSSFEFHRNKIYDLMLGNHLRVNKKDFKEQLVFYARLKGVLETRRKELKIIDDFNKTLKNVTEATYWVFNIQDKEMYQALVKDRKAKAAMYRRKIKSMEVRLHVFEGYLKQVEQLTNGQ